MAAECDAEANVCIFQWKIENISQCWWLKTSEGIDSPNFIADALGGTKWSLSLYPMGYTDEKNIGVLLNRENDCNGPNIVEVIIQIAFLGEDGLTVKEKITPKTSFRVGDNWGFPYYQARETIFVTEKETFLPEDTLTVQCKIWKQENRPVNLKYLYARTTLRANRNYFVWRIENICARQSGLRKKYKHKLIDLDLVINDGLDRLVIDMISVDDKIKYFSYNTWIIDSDGEKENCGIKKFFNKDLKDGVLSTLFRPRMLSENKSRYLPNNVLSLDFEFTFSTVEHFEYRTISDFDNEPYVATFVVKEKPRNTRFLTQDLKSMYNDGILSDTEIRTPKKTFPAHKAILSARSAVFRRMFSNDMIEASSGHVDITDFDQDTIHRMLLYMYTDSLEDLQIESASELYEIADKYEILSLKSRCSSFLIVNLHPTNACDVLRLAVQYDDDDLNNSVQDYILGLSYQYFSSQEWLDFTESDKDLALKIVLKKLSLVGVQSH